MRADFMDSDLKLGNPAPEGAENSPLWMFIQSWDFKQISNENGNFGDYSYDTN